MIFCKSDLLFCYNADALWFAEGTKILSGSIEKHPAWVEVCTRDGEYSAGVSPCGQPWPKGPQGTGRERRRRISPGAALFAQLPSQVP